MRRIYVLGLLTLVLVAADAQTNRVFSDSAAAYRKKQDYKAAFRFLSKGIELSVGYGPYHDDLLAVAELACLSGQNDTAFYYLNWLLNTGEFEMITCDAQNDYYLKNLQSDGRWWKLFGHANDIKNNEQLRDRASIAACIEYQDSLKNWSNAAVNKIIDSVKTGRDLYNRFRHFDRYPMMRRKSDSDLVVFSVRINDSTYSFYDVQLPHHYRPTVSYPILFDLHGAVYVNTGFPTPLGESRYGDEIKKGMNQFFSEYGYKDDMIVVYPNANKDFNWMYPDDGFGMVPSIIRDMKQYFNIDDDRVFISGHSNGATGVVSYLLKDADMFAGFYGFNSNPRIRTGGTFIKNALNRSYFNEATDKDYYFPISGHDTLARIARSLGIDWKNYEYKGFPHWFPQFSESEPAFQLMFADMKGRRRNPFHEKLFWECDDVKHGRCDWLSIDELDTVEGAKDWQSEVNFPVTHWIDSRDTSKVSDTVVEAFAFPRRSGAVRANYHDNVFSIQSSRVGAISLYLSPEMVDLSRNVVVYANGKKIFDRVVSYDRDYMIAGFMWDRDRKAIWVSAVSMKLN
jgi:predicted esterase